MKEEMQNTKVITGKLRLTYVSIFTPKAVNPGEEERYSLCGLIDKKDEVTVGKIRKAVEAAKTAGMKLWGDRIPGDFKLPLRDGDVEKPDQPEYAGHYFINATSRFKPGVMDRNRNEITDSREVYSGCYGRISIVFFPYCYNAENSGIGCCLHNVQKLADGEHLTGRARPEEDFDDLVDDEDYGW